MAFNKGCLPFVWALCPLCGVADIIPPLYILKLNLPNIINFIDCAAVIMFIVLNKLVN